jgi:hypothetical protein
MQLRRLRRVRCADIKVRPEMTDHDNDGAISSAQVRQASAEATPSSDYLRSLRLAKACLTSWSEALVRLNKSLPTRVDSQSS